MPEFTEYSSFTFEHAPSVVHVIFSEPLTIHGSPPFGAVMVSPGMIVKSAFDSSFTVGSVASDILTRTVLLTSAGIVHPYDCVPQAVDAMMSLGAGYVPPESVEYSSFTFATEPTYVHVMFSDFVTVHSSPPLGAVSVNEPIILKLALETSYTFPSATLMTFTRIWLPRSSGMVHSYVPALPSVDATICVS